MTAEEFLSGVSRLNATAARAVEFDARQTEGGQRLWQAALMLMVVSLAAEVV